MSRTRATAGAADGGLGLRSARTTTLPAAIASVAEARPRVLALSSLLPPALGAAVMAHLDTAARRTFAAPLSLIHISEPTRLALI
eukprot:6006538-Alexandrium_andersonii.AAC.1